MREFSDLQSVGGKFESLEVAKNARFLWVNDAQLENDFPDVSKLNVGSMEGNLPTKQDIRRAFLLANCSVVATSMTRPNPVVREIPVLGEQRKAFRPQYYGRAAVIESHPINARGVIFEDSPSIGLFDLKGIGLAPTRTPRNTMYKTGLLTAVSAFRELANQLIVERLAQNASIDIAGVPLYAAIDIGMRGPTRFFRNDSSYVILVRQAHNRLANGSDLARYGNEEHLAQEGVEKFLASYGLTTTSPEGVVVVARDDDGTLSMHYMDQDNSVSHEHVERFLNENNVNVVCGENARFHAINVQLAYGATTNPLKARLVDFHHYRPSFPGVVNKVSFVDDRPLNWGNFWSREVKSLNQLNFDYLAEQSTPESLKEYLKQEVNTNALGVKIFGLKIARMVDTSSPSPELISSKISEFVNNALKS